jgi:hypothetical protein
VLQVLLLCFLVRRSILERCGVGCVNRLVRPTTPEAGGGFIAGDLRNLVTLFFGGPFVGAALMTASLFLPGWFKVILSVPGCYILNSYVQRVKRVGVNRAGFIILGWSSFLAVIGLSIHGIALLASSGAYANGRSSHAYVWVQLCVSESIAWLVLGIPNRAFAIRLDPDGQGYSRAALLNVLVWVATALTGVNILMLHFLGGPLRFVNTDALTIGVIFAVVLVAPIYRFVAVACWSYGLAGIFSSGRTIERWQKILLELRAASATAAKPNSESAPRLEPVRQRLDRDDGSDSSAVGESAQRSAAVGDVVRARHESSAPAVVGQGIRRARKKARKAGGTAR